jgi:hypothetical protein
MDGTERTLDPRTIPDVSKVCSVYRRETGLYDYYRVRRPPGPKPVTRTNPVGIALADALPDLPRPAQRLGRGEYAVGTVVNDSRIAFDISDVVLGAAIAGAVSAVVSWLLRG